jgi:hypothetical protein
MFLQNIRIALRDLRYFFPVRLLFAAFKRQQFLLLSWLVFFLLINRGFGLSMGVPYLFLDPEYLGRVGYLSYSLVGMGWGIHFVFWNLVSYMLNAHRYPFMASLRYPMLMFFLNNSIIPLASLSAYIYAILRFQRYYEFATYGNALLDIAGLLAGITLSVLLFAIYFQFTNTSAQNVIEREKRMRQKRNYRLVRKSNMDEELLQGPAERVDYYLTNSLRIRHTRKDIQHQTEVRNLVFRQHHLNAFFLQILTIGVLIGLGFFVDIPIFQIPTAASVFMFASLLISLFGIFIFYTLGWGTIVIIGFLIAANFLTKFEILGYQSRVTGLNYEKKPAVYDNSVLRKLASDSLIASDRAHFLKILENWKTRNCEGRAPGYKPHMVFINVSGGGLRAAAFVTNVLQRADSLLGGKLFEKTVLISGASGGMFGASFMRDQYLMKQEGFAVNLRDSSLRNRISRDLLNPMIITFLSNDILIPFHKEKIGEHKYFRDRGLMFEKQLALNLGPGQMRPISFYKKPEQEARIPLMIYHTTIINDSRRLFISPQPVSFLSRPPARLDSANTYEIDGIDYGKLFSEHDAYNSRLASVNRINATFPYIFPNPVLPTDPPLYLMDAGVVDNFGTETSQRFIHNFSDWIRQNTCGITVIQIRDSRKNEEPEKRDKRSFLAEILDPIGVMYNNLENLQDYRFDYYWNYLKTSIGLPVEVICIEYEPESKEKKASMSLHLTDREKAELYNAMFRPNNSAEFSRLVESLYH